MRRLIYIFLLTTAFISNASGAEISVLPALQEKLPGEGVGLILDGDFTDEATLGGGMDISFDPAVFDFDAFNGQLMGDPNYFREPDISSGLLAGFAFGDFTGMSGDGLIAALGLTVRPDAPPGTYDITVAASTGIAGPFASNVDFQEQTVTFVPAQVTIIGQCTYTVTSPGPVDAWNLGSVQAIRWESTGNDCGASVSVELLDGGTPLTTLAASSPNDGAFTWVVGGTPPGTDYSIRITDLGDPSYTDDSGVFSVVDDPEFIFSTSYE